MLTLEQQVTSLELSKKLSEFGVRKNSLFHWAQCPEDRYYISDMALTPAKYLCAPAYTAAELLAMLPWICGSQELVIQKRTLNYLNYIVSYPVDDPTRYKLIPTVHHENLANALAIMLIDLIENNHVTVAEINKEA